MSSTGMIFKAESDASTLPADWVPPSLGPRKVVEQLVDDVMQAASLSTPFLKISLEIEDEIGIDPRCISVSGVWGPMELAAIKSICNALDARFYDAELSDFIDD